MKSANSTPAIRWTQIYSLLALDLAIIISWIAYHECQPDLVKQFRFTELTLFLAVAQGLILLITPPIAGLAADRVTRKNMRRLPVISVGINFVSMVFMVVAFTIFLNPQDWMRWLFPVMVVLWLISMNIFHSPAISMIETFVPAKKLPQVIALFAVLADACMALQPSIVRIIHYFGPPITFGAGGILVFVTGWLFMRTVRASGKKEEEAETAAPAGSRFGEIKAILFGIVMGAASTLFFKMMPGMATKRIPLLAEIHLPGEAFVSLLILAAAIITWPLGRYASRTNINRLFLISFLLSVVLELAIWFTGAATPFLILCCLFPVVFALLSVTALPLAFNSLSPGRKVLGIGFFFSGIQLTDSILDIALAMQV